MRENHTNGRAMLKLIPAGCYAGSGKAPRYTMLTLSIMEDWRACAEGGSRSLAEAWPWAAWCDCRSCRGRPGCQATAAGACDSAAPPGAAEAPCKSALLPHGIDQRRPGPLPALRACARATFRSGS